MRSIISFLLFTLALPVNADQDALNRAIQGKHRDAANVARDAYRNPAETLSLFGIEADLHVLEILPGAGWYTEILAPYLQPHGKLSVASFGAEHSMEYLRNLHLKMVEKFEAQPQLYGAVEVGVFQEGDAYLNEFGDESFDMVLTFRNSHNWIRFGGIEEVYKAIRRVLKPGGTLGVVQHRAAPGSDAAQGAQQGYVPEAYMISLLEGMGFELVKKSEVNANPKDTKDHPEGVWTLPPSYRLGDKDREKYRAIGESDRMTMKFVKLK